MVLVSPEQETLPARTAAGFTRAHGRAPQVVGRAPGRVNLIGEHTDYNGGPCLPLALPHAAYAAVARRDDARLHATTSSPGHAPLDVPLAELAPGAVPGWGGYVAGVVWALREEGYALPGLAVHVDAVVPPGAGLASSAALAGAVAVAVAALLPDPVAEGGPDRDTLLRACLRAERDVVGAPTGGMDQVATLQATRGDALLLDFAHDPPSRRTVPLAPVTTDHTLLVLDSGVRHQHTSGEYGARRAECAEAARHLGVTHLAAADPAAVAALPGGTLRSRATHVVTETARVHGAVAALASGDAAALGALLTASHASLRDDFAVSVPELDLLVDTAVQHGALGARLTGGGFGGAAVALVPHGDEEAVTQAVLHAAREHGSPEPAVLPVTPADAAAVVPPESWDPGREPAEPGSSER